MTRPLDDKVNDTGILAVPLPKERKRGELALARSMVQAIETILSWELLGPEAAELLIAEIMAVYPETIEKVKENL